jgi:hypothetical protein
MSDDDFKPVFAQLSRCIVAIGPYQRDVVLAGGLVPVAYRAALPGASTRLAPLATFDLDWMLAAPLKERGRTLHDRLLTDFEPHRTGSGKLPVTKYFPRDLGLDSPIYIEFIAPRSGGKRDRDGANQGVLEVQPNLHAQTDPYAGMLLIETMCVDASQIPQLGLSDEHKLQLPNPLCFILQKALIRNNRSSNNKRDNDACHMYDVAMLTRDLWPEMNALAVRLAKNYGIPLKWVKRAFTTISDIFSSSTSSGVTAAVLNYSPATSTNEVLTGMKSFLEACRIA